MLQPMQQPLHRIPLRRKCGMLYYGAMRNLLRVKKRKIFAKAKSDALLAHSHFHHRTILLRKLWKAWCCRTAHSERG